MRWFGFMGLIVYWAFTLIAVKINSSWFSLSKDTFSKLGKPEMAKCPWIFWLGLTLGGILVAIYGLWLSSGNRLQAMGGAYLILAGALMILIGPIHDGLKPHDTLAFLTFFMFYIGSALYGLGSSNKILEVSQPLILATAIASMFFHWPSDGYLELFGISLGMVSSFIIAIYS